MKPGEGVWWQKTDNWVIFNDGDDDPDNHQEGPPMMNFENDNLKNVREYISTNWIQCIDDKIVESLVSFTPGTNSLLVSRLDFILYGFFLSQSTQSGGKTTSGIQAIY